MLRELTDFVLMVLATDMASRTYIDDPGPADIFWNSDQYFYNRRDRNAMFRFISEAIRCLKCLSLWMATLLLIVRSISRPLFLFVSIPLSVSRIVIEWSNWFEEEETP